MRILLLNYEYPPLGGGAGVATAALARRLSAAGNRVDVVTAAPGPRPELDQPLERLRVFRVRTRRRGLHEAGLAGAGNYLLAALPLVRRLAKSEGYQIIHVFFSLPTGALLPFLPPNGARVVVSLRGSDVPGYDVSSPKLRRAHRLLLPATRWVWQRADRVVAVCDALGRLAQRSDPTLRYEVIRNGVDLDRFRPGVPRRTGEGPIRCIAVSRLIRRKGLADLLRAVSLLPPGTVSLEIAGDGPLRSELEELASSLRIGDAVRFLGVLDRDVLAERYRESDLFTLAPYEEAFGNVFAEALASGLPIVGSDVGGVPDLVTDGENGLLVQPGDTVSIAGAIQRLAHDHELRHTMRQRNRQRAETTLSWDAMTAEYLALYARLVGHSRDRSLAEVP